MFAVTAQYVLVHCAFAPHAVPFGSVPEGGTHAVTGLLSKKLEHDSDGYAPAHVSTCAAVLPVPFAESALTHVCVTRVTHVAVLP